MAERSFIMIKPDGVQRGLVGSIMKRFEGKGFQMLALKQEACSIEHMEKHYADLATKGFFPSLIKYMTSAPVVAMVWSGEGVVAEGRKMLGATKPSDSLMGTIRGDFCIDIGRNVCHGSDCVEAAEREIQLWFPEGVGSYDDHSAAWVYESPPASANAAAGVGGGGGAAAAVVAAATKRKYTLNVPDCGRVLGRVVLAGDIGGTNSRFELYDVLPGDHHKRGHRAPGGARPLFGADYKNDDAQFKSFDDVLLAFLTDARRELAPLAQWDGRVVAACLAVAGCVTNNSVTLTNLADFVISGEHLQASTGIASVRIINDFLGQAYGLLTLHGENDEHYVQLQGKGSEIHGEPIACIGAGTGLGVAFLSCDHALYNYQAFPSEGGHIEWSPRSPLEVELQNYIKLATGSATRVSLERVISGIGLRTVYEFLREYRGGGAADAATNYSALVDAALDARIQAGGAKSGADLIAMHASVRSGNQARKGSNPVCSKAMEIMMRAYGAAVGSAALMFLPRNGLFVVGGIAPKNMDWITPSDSVFRQALNDKGRQAAAIADIPVKVVTQTDCGLRGAHVMAYRELVAVETRLGTSVSRDALVIKATLKKRYIATALAALALGVFVWKRER